MVEVLNREVHVVGLSGDYKRNSFGQVLELEPLADDFSTLPSLTLCERCIQYTRRTPALFTHRFGMGIEQVEVGSDNYIPVCRKCYMELNPPAVAQ
jgi:thymidine kinase